MDILSPRSDNFLSLFERTHPHIKVFGTSAYYGGVTVENVATWLRANILILGLPSAGLNVRVR